MIRSAPQVTAECVHQQEGELLLLQTIRTHSGHAVLLCYGCVLMRKLCHLSIESTELFVRHGIVSVVSQSLSDFPEDAILQASACGCLAVLAQASNPSKNEMLTMPSPNVLQLVLESLGIHREYSNLTRQVQIYACEGGCPCVTTGSVFNSFTDEMMFVLIVYSCCFGITVLTELCDFGGANTTAALLEWVAPKQQNELAVQLLVSLIRESLIREDKKVTCAFCTLLLWYV